MGTRGEWIEIPREGGSTVTGYLATPKVDAHAPGVVVVQEYWDLKSSKSHITDTCDRLAEAGFRALAPDLYHGQKADSAGDAQRLMQALDWAAAVGELRAAVKYLEMNGRKAAVLGFCMGGALSIASAIQIPEVSAAVCFYGIPAGADASKVRVPLLGHFATHDDWCNAKAVSELEKQLAASHVEHAIHWYDAKHAFANDHRPEVHDAAATRVAWDRSIAFLTAKLK